MESPNCRDESLAFYQAYLNRDELDLDKLYKGYDTCADFIAAAFYKEMLQKYPDAKVILTELPVESWFKSIKNTIIAIVKAQRCDPSDSMFEFHRFSRKLIFDGLLEDSAKLDDQELFKKMYLDHNAEVKRLVPAERLYVMQTGEGWEGICKFLGKDVPDVPYSHLNNTEAFRPISVKCRI
jgi:hypothetical protein